MAIGEGATLVSFLPDAVMSLSYATPNGMTTAQRSAASAPYHILSTFTDGRPAQRCSASEDMARRLGKLATLTARRGLSREQREAAFPDQLGVIDVRDTVIAEPAGPVLVFANKDRTALAVVVDGGAAEVTLQAAELEWMEKACLGFPSTAQR
ncbi:hypothetical protein G4G28_02725 [Massilia sp. Dwa41.01b]|uniref:hypothetical protein n=1 Tax=unclassified Massilia TaxID=2609279 RepID=UPI0016039D1D|nr:MULTISPECIES: hypothetical protein [unclassified Massilia]QNA87661.1 hypothetical protein G4G28_02725 [Massilia sp. Dwa41.01b]QNA98562.1 hypothetical protein G4G31_06465 [Massilia sp. Se16.2.3]